MFELPGYRSARAVVKDGVANATVNLTCKTVSVAADGRITFTYPAPDAKSVQVCGNFFQLENGTFGEGIAQMAKNADGLWTYTTVPTKSELYRYAARVESGLGLADRRRRAVHHP